MDLIERITEINFANWIITAFLLISIIIAIFEIIKKATEIVSEVIGKPVKWVKSKIGITCKRMKPITVNVAKRAMLEAYNQRCTFVFTLSPYKNISLVYFLVILIKQSCELTYGIDINGTFAIMNFTIAIIRK